MAKIYTGIEFNNTPENIRSLLPRIAAQLKKEGWFLRTSMVGFYSQEGIRRSHFAAGIDMPLFGFYDEEVLPMLYLAKKYNIPVINLAHKANLDRILYWLGA